MPKSTLTNVHDLVDGLIYGRLVDAGIDPREAAKISTRSANFVQSEIAQKVTITK